MFKEVENIYIFYYLQVMSISSQKLVDWVFSLFITNIQKIFSVRKALNNKHFSIVHGKSIYQYQSLIILSESVGVNTKIPLVYWLF